MSSSASDPLLERRRRVALLARAPERALVDIVAGMTAVTIDRGRDLGHILDRVAGMTLQPLMGAGQPEAGLSIVIEPPSRPAVRIVALGTFCRQTPLMMGIDRKSTRLNSSHIQKSRMPSSA